MGFSDRPCSCCCSVAMMGVILKLGILVAVLMAWGGRAGASRAEVEVLMEIKSALDPTGKILHSWVAEGDPCSGTFEGVACNEHGKVANVSLQGKGLSGSLPSSVAELKCLSGLYLHYNMLKGQIPEEFSNLTELLDLYLNVNMLSGSIPGELGSMSSLQALQLCCNELEGSIPMELGSLQKLSVLALQHNHLTGAIPSSLGKLPFLSRLDLSFNFLRGFIPRELTNLPQLTMLDVRNNNLSGFIPEGNILQRTKKKKEKRRNNSETSTSQQKEKRQSSIERNVLEICRKDSSMATIQISAETISQGFHSVTHQYHL